jgi:hypothetical protein
MAQGQGRAARRLAVLASLLEPERAPFYVRRPVPPGLQSSFPADGWYWVPHNHHVAVFAGASEVEVAVLLYRLIDERIDETNDRANSG